MIDSLKTIPTIAAEIYTSLTYKNCQYALTETIKAVAKTIFAVGFYSSLTPICPYLLAISFTVGLGFPEFFMEKTSRIFASVLQTKNLTAPQATAMTITKIWFFFQNLANRAKPVIITGLIGFFGLPVVSVQIFSVLAGLRLGAHIGLKADMSENRLKYQPLYL